MNTVLKHTDLMAYQRERTWIDWCRSNGAKFWSLNTVFPFITNVIADHRISLSESQADSTSLVFGNISHHVLKSGFQNINQDASILDVYDFSTMSLERSTNVLNSLKIFLPFDKITAERIMTTKYFSHRNSAKSVLSEDIQRYVDKIQVVGVFEDVLKPAKEFPCGRIIDLLNQVYSSKDLTDMTEQITDLTNYDLSYLSVFDGSNLVVYDQSAQKILFSYIKDFNDYISDFTNLFHHKSVNQVIDATFYNHRINGSEIIKYIDSSHDELTYKIGSHFDQSFILIKENLVGDLASNITTYAVPVWYQIIMPDKIPTFFHTVREGYNEWAPNQFCIPYGNYVRDVLRFYYGFTDNLVNLIMKLIIAWVMRNINEDLVLSEINRILEEITGGSHGDEFYYTNMIKTVETEINSCLMDLTSVALPVVYSNGIIDLTTDAIMAAHWTLDDIYQIMTQLNVLKIIYLFDFGYDGDLNMCPSSVIMSRDSLFAGSGYLGTFSAVNNIRL